MAPFGRQTHTRLVRLLLLCAIAVALLAGSSAARTPVVGSSAAFTFTTIDVPGANNTEARGINREGQIVGFYGRPEGSGAEGFLLDQGVFTTIDFPGAVDTLLTDITGRGKVLGFYTAAGTHRSALSRHPFTIMWPLFPRGDVTSHGFLLHHGVFMPFDVPGSMETVPLDFNGQREIVGGYVDTSSALHAFLLKDGTFSTIDVPGAADTQASGINSGGQIVGTYDDGTIAHGFLRQPNGTFTTIDVPGALHTLATSINGHGQIVGFYYSPKAHGFLLDQGVFTTIDVPGAEVTFPWKIKGKRIVGGYQDFNGFTHGFLATP